MRGQPKKVIVDFFVGRLAEGSKHTVPELLSGLAEGPGSLTRSEGRFTYELRGLAKRDGCIRGCLAKFRSDDLPHAGRVGGAERELPLDDDEGILDKNYFVLELQRGVIAYQRNGNASRIGRLESCLSQAAGETVTFDPLLQKEALDRFMKGKVDPIRIEVSFARPTNPDLYPSNEWDKRLMDLVAETDAARVSMKLSVDRRRKDSGADRLAAGVRDALLGLVRSGQVSTARVDVIDEGVQYPIDLLADRLVSHQDVVFNGRYPQEESIYGALFSALEERQGALDAYLGAGHRRLR